MQPSAESQWPAMNVVYVPSVTSPERSLRLLVPKALQLAGARLGHAAHTLPRVEPGDRALTQPVIQAVGVAILNPEPLRGTELVVLLRAHGVFQRLLIGNRHPL